MGGEVIKILGSRFVPSALLSCLFGSKRAQGLFVSNTTVVCQVPTLDAGNIPISLSFDGQTTTNAVMGNAIPAMSVMAVFRLLLLSLKVGLLLFLVLDLSIRRFRGVGSETSLLLLLFILMLRYRAAFLKLLRLLVSS